MASDAISIVPITLRDAEQLNETLSTIDPWVTYGTPASVIGTYLVADEPGAPRFTLRRGDTVVGALGLRLNWLRGPYVQFLAILPVAQGQGIGKAALDWVEADARRIKAGNMWICASQFNARAVRFYERHGFVRVAEIEDLIAPGMAEILLRKRLAY